MKFDALRNIEAIENIVFRFDVSHFEMSELKEVAPSNIPPISVTLDVFQSEIDELNLYAFWNI